MEYMILFIIFIFGICIGSFLNVCIHRMPREESIVFPSSHCPSCKAAIAWKDNIPLFGYLWLKGRCRSCHSKISIRYFLTELFTGFAWLGMWLFFGLSPFFFVGIFLVSVLIAVTFIDFETQLIPDKLTLPGMLIGLILSAVFPVLHHQDVWYLGLLQSFIGLLAGGGILLSTAYIADLIFKKESMGGGDIKLLAMLGTMIGWQGAIFAFFAAPFFALPYGLYYKIVKKSDHSAYGPFLSISGLIFYLYGEQIFRYLFRVY